MVRWSSAAVVVSLAILILFAVASHSAPDATSLIQQGDQAFDKRFNITANQPDDFFTAYLPFLRQAIDAYQQAVPLLGNLPVQSQAHIYNRLSQLDYELSKLLTDQSDIEKALLVGKDAALASMKLHPGFDEQNVAATVKFVDDAAPLEWGGNNWGTYLGFHPLQGLTDVGKVQALYERAIAVDETYQGGSPHNSLGSLLAAQGDLPDAKSHFERAIAIDSNYLENYVVYVQYFGFSHDLFTGQLTGVRLGQEDFIQKNLNFVLDAPIESTHPLWSWFAKREAQQFLDQFHKFKG
jgi:tetratricopeptide (TPR) repeat protein